MKRIAILTLSLAASGCALFGGNPALRNNPNFREGYEDGCATATDQGADLRGRPVQDKALYAADKAYREGWSSGFETCRPLNRQTGTGPGESPVPEPVPGSH